MILSFSGDAFLATRAARKALREQGISGDEVVELGEGMDAETVARQALQGGLFGRVGLLLDLDAAFRGREGVKPRNEVIDTLGQVPEETVVVVLDLSATGARQKRYAEIGTHKHLPTPRFNGLVTWIRGELQDAGLRFSRDVPETLADLFGEDLPGISGEIAKMQALGEELTGDRVRQIVGRAAARDAFDLIDAIVKGDTGKALSVCDSLLVQGEAPQRVMGALNWQFDLVARCVALRESRGRLPDSDLAKALGAKPFVAKKAKAIASGLGEGELRACLAAMLESDRALKGGRDERWALESLALRLSELFSRKQIA